MQAPQVQPVLSPGPQTFSRIIRHVHTLPEFLAG